ncbi:Cyclic pyranopterin monophosphate synthase [Clostridium ljungdahlii DSM 13528]|uniref:Cyclic pyranopterin monophosphate synthase n=1 Tax=Clostridium ljungdahlii (strain ATCC 55383 / DSM 13528 / PETC) TaxID=748727 RepID=D8GKV4_CLOLD|nr:radical SAM protein [Clostridium ljungdahlii]ADK13287.1 putative Fe-S oxidoreductase [Clostridium ljungdahlii DSM 13528]OAA88905.1 Cyclic pyranopterin monophosphate synthase [Clostridium ljungdahlii DSM 13528]
MKVTGILEKATKNALAKAGVELLNRDPEESLDKLFALIKKTVKKDEENLARVERVQELYETNQAIHKLVIGIIKNSNKKCMDKLFTNFFSNAVWYGMPKREQFFQDTGIKTPFTILMSPSMRCNLRCIGCYASSYSKEDDIPKEEVDRIIGEARKLGIYYFIILGGEPFINDYMLDIYKKYNDCIFTPFSNGTLFDEKLADKIKQLGNVIPMFSVEGFEEETDKRRGKGIFKKVMHAMDLLKERGVLFGVSTATSRYNIDTVTSSEFIDMLVEKGAKMGWYFLFMPVGKEPDVNVMLTPEQRIRLGEKIREIRNTKPYFTIDFFNDAPYVGGCIAGKYYCHINSKEEVEPCIFAHFAVDNLKGKKLVDVFKSDFFKELRNRQPYNKNLLLPCMMIDNTNEIREIAKKTGAKPTDEGARMMLEDLEFQKQLDKLSKEYKPYAEKAWKKDFNSEGNYKMSKG